MDRGATIEKRLDTMKQLYEAGIKTTCFISPIFFLFKGAFGFRTKAQDTRGKKLFTGSYGSYGTRCTDRNGNKVSSYPYEGAGNNSYGTRCTDRNASKVPSYPYKRSVDSSYTT